MKLKPVEVKILQKIYESYGQTDIFTLYKKIKIPLFKLNTCINILEKNSYIEIDKTRIYIKKEGKLFLHSKEVKDLLNNDKSWKKMPDDFLGNKIKINDFYTPNYNLFK